MKLTTRIMMSAILAAGFVAQNVSAGVLFTNAVKNIQAINVRMTLSAAGVPSVPASSLVNGAIRNQYVVGTGGITGKSWIQFDLSSIWALYGEANLTNATLTLWNQNDISRRFWVAGLADGAGLEGWDANTLLSDGIAGWTNAPANVYNNLTTMGWAFDYTKCYGGTNIWEVNTTPQGTAVYTAGNSQGAFYLSTNSTSVVKQFLKTDTDGKVTMLISCGRLAGDNQTVPIGTNGVYAGQPLAPNGISTKDSPALTLIFDVRVALTGGGVTCLGGGGVNVSMFGTDVGYNYLLYTNGVYAQTVIGTGSAVSFGNFSTPGAYTAVASNTTTTATAPVPSNVTVAAPVTPSFLVQPASVVAATNSLAIYTVSATNADGGYQWFRNGTALSDDGHYSGTATSQLMVNPVLATDAATAANGYYCRIQNLCGAIAYSTTNALTVQVARNLVWDGSATNIWDIATTTNWWLNTVGGTATTFISGDNVTLDNNGVYAAVLNSPYLAPGVITVSGINSIGIPSGGTGKIFGPNSSLVVSGASSQLVITNANTFAGGTTINDGTLVMRNNGSVGTNTIIFTGTGSSKLEIVPTSAGSIDGLPALSVIADSTLQVDGNGSAAAAFLGPINGTLGKTLTVNAITATPGANLRLWGNFTSDVNLALNINGANWAQYQTGTTIYNGVLSGNGILYTRGGTTILNGQNTFNQTVISIGHVGVGIDSSLPTYSPLGLGTFMQDNQGDRGIQANGGARIIENPMGWIYRGEANSAFMFIGTNQLTMSGQVNLDGGTNGVTRILRADNTAPTILSGVITDNGANCGVIKTGNGKLYLNNVGNTYTGNTIISAGVLAGSGNVPSALIITNGGVGGGSAAAIGTLSVAGNVTFSGTGGAYIRVNKSLSPAQSNDTVAVTGTLSNSGTGTITVTNLGSTLQAGDRFVLFPGQTIAGGNTLTVTGAGMIWTNKLAIDGSIQVLGAPSTVATNSTNITYSVSGSTLTLTWPTDHIGWSLQAQTNTLGSGLRTNWTTIGYTTTNSVNIPINPANPAVFYRLTY